MDYRIFNVRTDVNACDCTRGWTNTVRESAKTKTKFPCRTGESNLRQRRDGQTVYQLSYVPIVYSVGSLARATISVRAVRQSLTSLLKC